MSDSSSDEITEKSLIDNKNKRRKIDRFAKNSEHNELSETFDILYSSKVKNEPNEIENTSLTNNSYKISENDENNVAALFYNENEQSSIENIKVYLNFEFLWLFFIRIIEILKIQIKIIQDEIHKIKKTSSGYQNTREAWKKIDELTSKTKIELIYRKKTEQSFYNRTERKLEQYS